jgi:hypothetical protein
LILAAYAVAEQRDIPLVNVGFGAGDMLKLTGASLSGLMVKWDDGGLRFLHYKLTPWRGMINYQDMFVVNDGKILYKRSEHQRLNIDLHFQLTPMKHFEDLIYLVPPIAPFTFETGEIWWIFKYTEGGEAKMAAAVWNMKTNQVTYKPYQP